MSSPQFLQYNALDSACTLECYQAFWQDLTPDYTKAYQLTVSLLPVISFMQTRGIRVDMEELAKTSQDIVHITKEKQAELDSLCGRPLNTNSSKDCQKYFYVEKGIPPYYNEGSVTTDDLALQRIARGTARRSGLREAKLVQEVRGLQKLYSTYLSMEFDKDGRFRSAYNVRGSKFGRLSSSKTIFGTGGNSQNLDPAFKRFLVPDPGYFFWEIDKRQAEWVVVAYLTGDANMLSIVESGKDTHLHTGSLILSATTQIPYDDCWALLEYEDKLIGHMSDPTIIADLRASDPVVARFAKYLPRTMSGRQKAKKSNHGLNYDEGYKKYSLINELEESEGKRDVALYHMIYPGIRVWYETIKRQLQKDRALTNYFGRRVRFMDAWGDELFKAAYSMLPQSTVVDSLNIGMVEMYDEPWLCGRHYCNIDILAQVHDSILMQVPIESGLMPERFSKALSVVYDAVSPLITYNGRTFKIATDSKIGLNWGGYNKERNPMGMRDLKRVEDIQGILQEFSNGQA